MDLCIPYDQYFWWLFLCLSESLYLRSDSWIWKLRQESSLDMSVWLWVCASRSRNQGLCLRYHPSLHAIGFQGKVMKVNAGICYLRAVSSIFYSGLWNRRYKITNNRYFYY
jgi:hypothetical protein